MAFFSFTADRPILHPYRTRGPHTFLDHPQVLPQNWRRQGCYANSLLYVTISKLSNNEADNMVHRDPWLS
jgi:hypothetical protein